MNFKQLCEEIAKREKAKGREVNITQIRAVMRRFFEIVIEKDAGDSFFARSSNDFF